MSAAEVWALAVTVVAAYLVVMGGVALLCAWSWWRSRRGVPQSARHRRDRTGAAGIVAGGGS
ncbi:MAG: hypothetical protein LC799_08460 [Actinobacteria bacterium]|nr:hypothetical protein [Actinomycetota bacterium]